MRKKILLLLMLLLCLSIVVTAADRKTDDGLQRITVKNLRPRTTRADDSSQGLTTTLKYEQVANMLTPRLAHQVFPSGNGFVVVGGRTTGFQLTKTAELFENGTWRSLSIDNPHDGAFSVELSDGRYMVGGGFSSGLGVGQSKVTDIYDPKTLMFTAGPQLTVARAQSKAINVDGKVYVSGNWYADDKVMDCYDGSSFAALGETDDRTQPYMLADRQGNVYVLSTMGTQGQDFGYITDNDGDVVLLADRYFPATGETRYFRIPFTPECHPMTLSDDARTLDYHITYNGNNCYLILCKTTTGYKLYMLDTDGLQLYVFNKFDIPTKDAAGQTITWRGSVLTNTARKELYMIGTSGTLTNQALHVISLNYVTDAWTMASATGFSHNLLTASWTVLADGRLACTGGGIKDNTDAQRKAYIITLPTAGKDYDDTPALGSGPKLVVWLKSGEKVVYELADVPVTTFSGSQLVIRTNKVTIPYERKDVLRYTFEDVVTKGIELMPGERRVEINREGDEVIFRGLQVGSTARIYAVNGTLIEQRKVTDSLPLTLSLKNRPNGVYIVKAGTETIKLMKR